MHVVSVKSNVDQTHDGIAAGGKRIATEIDGLVRDLGATTLSFVGNSLGGLYARYALAHLDCLTEKEGGNEQADQSTNNDTECPSRRIVEPLLFVTTATPHLGESRNTYLPIPRFVEYGIGSALQQTGRDLFNISPIIHELARQDEYVRPLRRFRKRVAYANAFGTDFQVPVSTAAFLSVNSNNPHHVLKGNRVEGQEDNNVNDSYQKDGSSPRIALTVETTREEVPPSSSSTTTTAGGVGSADTASLLDSMGWTKVFCDVRTAIPLPSLPLPSFWTTKPPTRETPSSSSPMTSQQVLDRVGGYGGRLSFPMGHTVLIANSKSDRDARINANGKPFVNRLAQDMVADIEMCTTDRP